MGEREVRRVCAGMSLGLTQWKLAVAQGRPLLDSLCSSLYPDEGREGGGEEWRPEVQAKVLVLQDILARLGEAVASLEEWTGKAQGLEDLSSLSSLSLASSPLPPTRPKAQHLLINTSLATSRAPHLNTSTSTMNTSAPGRLLSSTSTCSPISVSLDTSVLPSSLSSWCSSLLSAHSRQLEMDKMVVSTVCHLGHRDESLYLTSVWSLQPALGTDAQVAEASLEALLLSCPGPPAL